MKKSILNLGKALNKTEQKNINGGLDGKKKSDSCYGTYTYVTPCPYGSQWSCWVSEINCDNTPS